MNSRRDAVRDPDRLAAIEEERDFLLRSLDDLEAEYAAGDLDQGDYEALRDDYTVRAAAAIRSIEARDAAISDARRARAEGARGRRLGWFALVAAGAILAGVLVARTAGERGVDDTLTGSLDESLRDQVLQCQQLGTEGADGLTRSLDCFDQVLDQDPNNVEALTYRGWYLSLVAASARDQGLDAEAAELYETASGHLDQAIAVDGDFADARVFRAVLAEGQGDPERACAELAVLDTLETAAMMEQLTGGLRTRLDC